MNRITTTIKREWLRGRRQTKDNRRALTNGSLNSRTLAESMNKTLIPQRPFFAQAELLGPAFTLERNGRRATCEVHRTPHQDHRA